MPGARCGGGGGGGRSGRIGGGGSGGGSGYSSTGGVFRVKTLPKISDEHINGAHESSVPPTRTFGGGSSGGYSSTDNGYSSTDNGYSSCGGIESRTFDTSGSAPSSMQSCDAMQRELKACVEANGNYIEPCKWYLRQWRACEARSRGLPPDAPEVRVSRNQKLKIESPSPPSPASLNDNDWARMHSLGSVREDCTARFRQLRTCTGANDNGLAPCRDFVASWEACQYGTDTVEAPSA